MLGLENKLRLYASPTTSKDAYFNIYDVCYAKGERDQKDYIAYIDEAVQFRKAYEHPLRQSFLGNDRRACAQHLETGLRPAGRRRHLLILEEVLPCLRSASTRILHARRKPSWGIWTEHVTVHTYPEYHPDNAIATFRVDIDVTTCGRISPLNALGYLIGS